MIDVCFAMLMLGYSIQQDSSIFIFTESTVSAYVESLHRLLNYKTSYCICSLKETVTRKTIYFNKLIPPYQSRNPAVMLCIRK